MKETPGRKATHDGSCQICGSRQRLPAGHLAQHGYTVDFNTFNGVCGGSRERPFEQDRAALGTHLTRARTYAEQLTGRLTALQGDAPDHRGFHALPIKGQRFKTQTHPGLFLNVEGEGNALYFRPDGREDVVQVCPPRPHDPRTPQDAADQCRAEQRAETELELRHLRSYLTGQQERYDAWTPRPLLPLTDSPEGRSQKAAERGPRPPTKKELSARKFRDAYLKKHGKEPLFTSHQTTSNNPHLMAFSHVMSTFGIREHYHYIGDKPLAAFTSEASRVMNLHGQEAFMAWLALVFGRPVQVVHDRYSTKEFAVVGSETPARCVSDLTGSLETAADLVKRGPPGLETLLGRLPATSTPTPG